MSQQLDRRGLLQTVGGAVIALTTADAAAAAPAVPPSASGPATPPARATVPLSPTGTQYELRHGQQRAVVTQVGATLRSYQVGGHEFLDTFGPNEMSRYGMGHVLAPWPGRIDHGRYTFQGETQQLPINEGGNQNALHGLVRYLDWKLATERARTDDSVTLGLVLFPTEGYPFTLTLAVSYRLTDQGLVVRTEATNAGSGPLPFGLGFHPYFNLGTGTVDSTVLKLPAATYLPTNERLVPTGAPARVAGTPFDFRKAKPIGTVKLDTTFTDLIRDSDGRAKIRLAAPQGGPSLVLAMDGRFRYVVGYTQDTLPEVEHRRRGICLEPLTCAPNAFNTGTASGLLVLEPGQAHRSEWSMQGTV